MSTWDFGGRAKLSERKGAIVESAWALQSESWVQILTLHLPAKWPYRDKKSAALREGRRLVWTIIPILQDFCKNKMQSAHLNLIAFPFPYPLFSTFHPLTNQGKSHPWVLFVQPHPVQQSLTTFILGIAVHVEDLYATGHVIHTI